MALQEEMGWGKQGDRQCLAQLHTGRCFPGTLSPHLCTWTICNATLSPTVSRAPDRPEHVSPFSAHGLMETGPWMPIL